MNDPIQLAATIKIFCPTDKVIFEAEKAPRVSCEITGHSLAMDFPIRNCGSTVATAGVHSPSKLHHGGSASPSCPHCERETVRRYFCADCSIFSYDSGELLKAKSITIDERLGPSNCPGCGADPNRGRLELHFCKAIDVAFLTPRRRPPS
jgi:hypothetical protein